MTHDPLCPTQTMCKCKDQECWDCRDVVLCQCELIDLAYERGWEAGYKQCEDEVLGKDRYN